MTIPVTIEAGRPVYHAGTDPEPTPFLRRTLASRTSWRAGRHRGAGRKGLIETYFPMGYIGLLGLVYVKKNKLKVEIVTYCKSIAINFTNY